MEQIVQGDLFLGHFLSGVLSDFQVVGIGQSADLGNYLIREIHGVGKLLFPGLTYTAELAIATRSLRI
jgi:hypothetical protein